MTDNSFAAKHPEDFERMAVAYRDANLDCPGLDYAKADLEFAIDAINAADWVLHPKPKRQVVHVGQAGERDGA